MCWAIWQKNNRHRELTDDGTMASSDDSASKDKDTGPGAAEESWDEKAEEVVVDPDDRTELRLRASSSKESPRWSSSSPFPAESLPKWTRQRAPSGAPPPPAVASA